MWQVSRCHGTALEGQRGHLKVRVRTDWGEGKRFDFQRRERTDGLSGYFQSRLSMGPAGIQQKNTVYQLEGRKTPASHLCHWFQLGDTDASGIMYDMVSLRGRRLKERLEPTVSDQLWSFRVTGCYGPVCFRAWVKERLLNFNVLLWK